MKLSFLCYAPVPDRSQLEERFAHVAALGYRGIELVATYPLGYRIEDVLALVGRYRLPVVSLLSGWSYAHEGLCLASPDVAVRGRAVSRLRDYIRLAAPLGAVVVVGLMQGLRQDEPDETVANERIAEGLAEAAAAAGEHGVTVVLEPVCHMQVGFNNSAAEAQAMVQRVNCPALGYMLDTIHMNVEERSLLETVRTHGAAIHHFHLCETHGGPFGTGGLDFDRVLAALQATGYARFASVKIYRKVGWADAARSAMAFIQGGPARNRFDWS